MSQYLVQYIITCSSDVSFESLITEYDPLVIKSIFLNLKNIHGGVCQLNVEEMTLQAAEELDEEE